MCVVQAMVKCINSITTLDAIYNLPKPLVGYDNFFSEVNPVNNMRVTVTTDGTLYFRHGNINSVYLVAFSYPVRES